MTACGGANAGQLLPPGAGGSGGAAGSGGTGGVALPPSGVRTFEVGCLRPDLDLTFDIELRIDLDEPFGESDSTEVTFTPAVTMSEDTAAALIDATVETIDITAMSTQTSLTGASPTTITTLLEEAPIQDFDLTTDPDENDVPGPHRFEFAPLTTTAFVDSGADEVEFVVSTVSFDFGDFSVPASCVDGISLVGTPLSFPVSEN